MDPDAFLIFVKGFSSDILNWRGEHLSGYYFTRLKNTGVPNVIHISLNLYAQIKLRLSLRERISFNLSFYFTNSIFAVPFLHLLNQKTIDMITVPNFAIKKSLTEGVSLRKKLRFYLPHFTETHLFPTKESKMLKRTRENWN